MTAPVDIDAIERLLTPRYTAWDNECRLGEIALAVPALIAELRAARISATAERCQVDRDPSVPVDIEWTDEHALKMLDAHVENWGTGAVRSALGHVRETIATLRADFDAAIATADELERGVSKYSGESDELRAEVATLTRERDELREALSRMPADGDVSVPEDDEARKGGGRDG